MPFQIASRRYLNVVLARRSHIPDQSRCNTILVAAHSTQAFGILLQFAGGYVALTQHIDAEQSLCVL
jgi:hypothetical protein